MLQVYYTTLAGHMGVLLKTFFLKTGKTLKYSIAPETRQKIRQSGGSTKKRLL
jgi:hypothetical protein